MTLLDPVLLQVADLDAIGGWYDQVVSLAGGTRTFDMPDLIGYAYLAANATVLLPCDPGASAMAGVSTGLLRGVIRDPAGNNLELKFQPSTG